MPQSPVFSRAVVILGILLAETAIGDQGAIRIRILDRDGAPVPEVAIYARPFAISETGDTKTTTASLADAADSGAPTAPAMNQLDLSFSPHLLIVETGTEVLFPNDDEVRHHVYSFSPAKRLNLTIDSHSVHSERPVLDTPGVVTLGCNIHDNMLAYILVVDTPYFAKTDANGTASLPNLDAGQFELNIWTSRLSASDLPEPEMVRLEPGESIEVSHQFSDKLYPAHEHSETSLHWSDY
jgi:plastocyanin